MNRLTAEDRIAWSFWAAGAIAFIGGLLPLLIGGTSSRVATVAIPFTIAAAAFAGCGFVHMQGRSVTAILYFVAGLAIVYGLLAMFSVPLQLAALGSCAAAPAPCSGGLGRPLTLGENTGMGFGTGFGVAALVPAPEPEAEAELELPAHEEEELPELPPHESDPSTT